MLLLARPWADGCWNALPDAAVPSQVLQGRYLQLQSNGTPELIGGTCNEDYNILGPAVLGILGVPSRPRCCTEAEECWR